MKLFNHGSKLSGFIGAMVLAASITTDTTVRAANVRDSYVQAFQRARMLQHIEANLYYNVKSTRFENDDIVIHPSEVTTVSGMEHFPNFYRTFRRANISNVRHLILRHTEFSLMMKEAIKLAYYDELSLKGRADGATTFRKQFLAVWRELNLHQALLSTIMDQLEITFDPALVNHVTFAICDVTCVQRRSLFILQELHYYTQLLLINFFILVSVDD